MTSNSNDFARDFRERLLELHWAQWVTLGVQGYGSEETEWLIDLEALLASTLFVGRFDQRLLERAVSWCRDGREWLNLTRLSRIIDIFSSSGGGEIPAVLDGTPARDVLEWIRLRSTAPFHGYKVGSPRVEEASFPIPRKTDFPDGPPARFASPALLQLMLRALFGVSANVETFIYLIVHPAGNSNAIANEICFSQRNIYHILENWSKTPLVNRIETKAENRLKLANKDKILACLGLDRWPRYVNWIKTWRLLDQAAIVYENSRLSKDPYLLSSRLRDLEQDIKTVASSLQVSTLPDFEAAGSRILPSMESSLKAILDALAAPTGRIPQI